MIIKSLLPVALVLAIACFWQTGRAAGDKKKQVPTKDIVFTDELQNADLKDTVRTESFRKAYTVKLEKHKLYQMILTSQDFTPRLRLENAMREQLDIGINKAGGSMIFHRPAMSDDYEIIVTSQKGGEMGKFTLVVKEIQGDDGKPIELKNDNGKGVYEGKLLVTDPIYRGGKKHKMLLFPMEAGKTYQIDMTSKVFDSYLFLESPTGKHITEDDDGGGFPSARIIHKAADTGLHRIACTYFSPATGDFKVTIRQID